MPWALPEEERLSLFVHPNQSPFIPPRAGGKIGQRSGIRNGEGCCLNINGTFRQRHGRTIHFEAGKIKRHDHQRSGPRIEQVARWNVAAGAGATHQFIVLASSQLLDMQMFFVRAWSCPDREQQCLAPRQKLRSAVADFAFASVQLGQFLAFAIRSTSPKIPEVL